MAIRNNHSKLLTKNDCRIGIEGYTVVYMGIQELTWVYRGLHGYTWVYRDMIGIIMTILAGRLYGGLHAFDYVHNTRTQ